MKQKIFMLLAVVLLSSANMFAQSSEPLKGDVNEDGVVDVADVVAGIDIIAKSQNNSETTYYWYVGQTDPSTMSSISPIVTDMTSPGWREIGTTIPNYSSSNLLWDEQPIVTGSSKSRVYVAFPNNTIKQYLSDKVTLQSAFDQDNPVTKVIDGVTYYIYQTVGTMKTWSPIVY